VGRESVAVLRVTPGSAAAAAGLQAVRVLADGIITAGDVIVAGYGCSIDRVARLLSPLEDYAVGDTVRLTVLRGNSKRGERQATGRHSVGARNDGYSSRCPLARVAVSNCRWRRGSADLRAGHADDEEAQVGWVRPFTDTRGLSCLTGSVTLP
jgi:hypothetical protein